MAISETDRFDVVRIKEKPATDPAEQLARLGAKEAILDLLGQYSHYCDAYDWEGALSLYTDDVERVLAGTLDERVKGKDTLRKVYYNPMLKRKADGKASSAPRDWLLRHMFTTPVVRLSDDMKEAWLTCYYTLVSTKETPTEFRRTAHEGTYIFTFARQGDDWKIKKMVIMTDTGHDPKYAPAPAK